MEVPHCKRCGQFHYRFVACDNVKDWNAKHAEKVAKKADPVIQNRSIPEGYRVITPTKQGFTNFSDLKTPEGFRRGFRPRRHDGDFPEAA